MILRIRDEQGKFVDIPSIIGPAGADGKTPERGVDYFTTEDIAEMVKEIVKQVSAAGYLTKEEAENLFAKKEELELNFME